MHLAGIAFALFASQEIAYVAPSTTQGSGVLKVFGIPQAKVPLATNVRTPSLAPNHRSLLYWTDGGDQDLSPIYHVDLATGTRSLYRNGNLRYPGYTRDGKSIFFTRLQDQWELILQPLDAPVVNPSNLEDADPTDVSEVAPILGKAQGCGTIWAPVRSGNNDAIVAHDLAKVYWVKPDGTRTRTLPITDFFPSAARFTSEDVFTDCPGNPALVAFTLGSEGIDRSYVPR